MVLLSDRERERLSIEYVKLCNKYNQMAERMIQDQNAGVHDSFYKTMWEKAWYEVSGFEKALDLAGVMVSHCKDGSQIYTQVKVEGVEYEVEVPPIFRKEGVA